MLPATQAQAAGDNAAAASRRNPNGGPFGPDTCATGFVWREACGPQDHVCVPPGTRDAAHTDNAAAPGRYAQTPILWDVLTQHNDPARSGAQPHESILKPSNVTPATFGRLYERHVDGQIIAQPLYVSNQWNPATGLHNVVYVATRNNSVYAFDADDTDPDPSHGLLWQTPVQVEPAAPVPGMCSETKGPLGITSTPVIDRASNTMYVVARKADGTIWLNALDLGTGQRKAGTPGAVQIKAAATSGGQTVTFNQGLELSRAGLLMQDGAVFVAFSALNCDNANWHGWVLAYRAPDLAQVGVFLTTPSPASPGAGVWQSGNGLVGDGQSVYFETGNRQEGTPPAGALDESFIKLKVGPAPSYGLVFAGSYQVSNREALNGGDTDLGSGGPTLLPGGRLVGGGKQGKLYVLDATTMQPTQDPPAPGPVPPGGSDGFQAFVNTWHDDATQIVCTNASMLQRKCYMPRARYEDGEAMGPNIHTGPVFWADADPAYALLYGMPEKDHLRAFEYDKATRQLASVPAAVSTRRSPDGMPGSFLAVSSNGAADGIIWALVADADAQSNNGPGRLVAFDAVSLKQIWEDPDDIGFAKFNPPTVAGGKVFRPTFADKLVVYGLKPGPTALPCYTVAQKYENYTGQYGVLGASTGAEITAPDGVGRFQHFAGGSIYWTPSTCAWEVHGSIASLWAGMGWEKSALGYPISDEVLTADGMGRTSTFQNGTITWTPLTGAHEVHGAIDAKWASLGREASALGYPLSDEADAVDGSGRFNVFEHGTIHWNRASGALTVLADAAHLNAVPMAGNDRPGMDITSVALPAAEPAMCEQQCADNGSCRSWTYVNPGVQGAQARCWLKSGIPVTVADACCTSGVKVELHPANMNPMEGAVDRAGGDFTHFSLPVADPRLCFGECAANGTCTAWAYVEPGVGVPNAPPACWLKDAAEIAPVTNGCCDSGTKH